MNNHAMKLARETAIAADIVERLKDDFGDDAVALRDTIEGATNLFEVLEAVAAQIAEDEDRIEALTATIKKISERRRRYESRVARGKQTVLSALEQVGIRSLELPNATLSLRTSRPAVNVYDPEVLPQGYWRFTKEPNKEFIKEQLEAGEEVPGATLSNRPPYLQMVR